MIRRLIVHRFRGIKEGILGNLGKVNFLVGPNNSGKTAILEMLYLNALAHRPCSFINPDLEPSTWPAKTLDVYDFLGLEPLKRIRQRHGEPEDWNESPADVTREGDLFVILSDIPDSCPLSRFILVVPLEDAIKYKGFSEKDIQRISLFQLEPWEIYSLPTSLIPPFFQRHNVCLKNGVWNYLWENTWVYREERTEGIDYLSIWAVEGTKHKHVVFFDLSVAERFFTERFGIKNYRKIPDWEKKIAQSLTFVFPEFEGCTVSIRPRRGKNWTGFIEFAGKTPLPIDHFGDGARHAFKVLASLIALSERTDEAHPGLFLWEDPELFMHPASLARLLKETMRIISGKPIQIFISTQSLEVITWLAEALEKSFVNPEDVCTIHLKLKQGVLKPQIFHGKEIIGWMEFIGDPRLIEVV